MTLTINSLTLVRGGRTLVRDLRLAVAPGEFVAITGASGAGKTTLLNALSDPPRTALLPQGLHLVPPQTLLDNALHGTLRFRPWWRRPTEAEIDAARTALSDLGLDPSRRAAVASGGERQRCALVRAVLARPACLLADEPVSQLDPETAERTLAWLDARRAADGFAVVAVLHQPELVARHATRVLHLHGDGTWT